MSTDPKVIAVARSIRASLEQNAGAGSAINSHPNPFYVNVSGAVDLYKAAEAALVSAARYDENIATRFAGNVKTFETKLREEISKGAASVEDALARLKQKAGGELIAPEGVAEEAASRVSAALATAERA